MRNTRRTLLERVRDPRDAEAWRDFFHLYAPLLESYAMAHGLSAGDAEDLRDQCLAVLVRRMPSFEYERSKGGFKRWLQKIAHDKIVDHLRRPRARRAETSELELASDRNPTPDEVWEAGWQREHLRYCLDLARAKEPERSFRAFELLALDELTVTEVCERMGMNENQVYKAKSRVLKRVRETLERLGGDVAAGVV